MTLADRAIALLALAALLAAGESPWMEGAAAIAGAPADRPVVVLLSIPACRWCDRMMAESAANPEVGHVLAAVAAVHIDAKEEPALAAQLGIESFPSLILANRKRRIVRILPGYLAPADLATAVRVLIQHGDADEGLGALDAAGAAEAEKAARAPDAAARLAKLLGRGPATRRAAARGLLLKARDAAAALWPLLGSDDLAVRVDASAVLAELAGPSAYDPFAPAAERERAAAAWRGAAREAIP